MKYWGTGRKFLLRSLLTWHNQSGIFVACNKPARLFLDASLGPVRIDTNRESASICQTGSRPSRSADTASQLYNSSAPIPLTRSLHMFQSKETGGKDHRKGDHNKLFTLQLRILVANASKTLVDQFSAYNSD